VPDAEKFIVEALERAKVLSARELAGELHMAVRTAQQHLANLIAAGRVHRQSGRPSRYALDPAHFWLALPPPPDGF
jgi:predicted ArsR family transcriptional regulator